MIYKGKVRVRACGILIKKGRILLIKHQGIGQAGYLWAPPGGGVDFGICAQKTVKKEFLEETGLAVEVGDFLFVNEFYDDRHHAIELFFKVNSHSNRYKLGYDPEQKKQILTDINFFSLKELKKMPIYGIHSLFSYLSEDLEEVYKMKGFYPEK